MKRFLAFFAAVAVSAVCFACTENYEYEYFEKDGAVFSGAMALYARLLGKDSPKVYDEMTEALERVGAEITLTDENSALSYFNERAGAYEKVEISEETYKLISLALEFEKETDGAFSVGVFNLSRLWGLDADALKNESVQGELPDYDVVSAAKENCDTGALTLTQSENGFFIEKSNAELKIDLGGIAKGYCADMCVELMKKYSLSSGLVNISGNIVLFGGYYDGHGFTDWEIAVTDPRPKAVLLRDEICCIGSGGDVSIVTSGDYRRYRRCESGLELCHIIDPRSGLPADIEYSDGEYKRKSEVVSSATVICSSSARADAYSTAFAVMGTDGAVAFLKGRTDVDALIFSENCDGETESRGRMAATDGIDFILTDTFGAYKRYEDMRGGKGSLW